MSRQRDDWHEEEDGNTNPNGPCSPRLHSLADSHDDSLLRPNRIWTCRSSAGVTREALGDWTLDRGGTPLVPPRFGIASNYGVRPTPRAPDCHCSASSPTLRDGFRTPTPTPTSAPLSVQRPNSRLRRPLRARARIGSIAAREASTRRAVGSARCADTSKDAAGF